ncbi:hypothetical protein SEUCBS140593_003111 [Sporothrix eucalyptigena]|uniref:Major facilitator superfamily (MFS) profile domain-containing protein n=1 Tax=Sporothrix eucalyptigena TaxID=1812306 RepID=A0ABP0BC28_9PEZI
MWVTECTKAHNRGKLVMMQGWLAIGGVCFATWLDFGFFYVKNSSVNWRFPIAFQAVFALIVLVLIMFLPESPRWLIIKEDYDAAEHALDRLYDMPEGSELIKSEVQLIRQSIALEQVGSSTNPFALTKNRHLQRTLTCISINILCQMTGVNIVTFYSNTIFQDILHYNGVESRVISGCMQIWQLVCAGIAILLIDRFGRRKLLVTCALGMAVGQAGLAALTKFATEGSAKAAGASLFFDFATLTFFPIGLFLLPLMYSAEIAPLRIRARVTAMSSASNWLFNFLLAEVTPVGFDNLGWKYYLVYMSISTFAAVFFYLMCPETKNRALEDIDEFFLRADTIWEPRKIAKTLPYDSGIVGALEEKIERAEHAETA